MADLRGCRPEERHRLYQVRRIWAQRLLLSKFTGRVKPSMRKGRFGPL
jgi:hypothetical protein